MAERSNGEKQNNINNNNNNNKRRRNEEDMSLDKTKTTPPEKEVEEEDDEEEEDEEDSCYGSTKESTPLKKKETGTSKAAAAAMILSADDVSLTVFKGEEKKKVATAIHYDNRFTSQRIRMTDDTASKDSDSLIHEVYYMPEKYDVHRSFCTHPKVRQNWKIVLAAFVLLLLGLGLLVSGILVEIMPMTGFKGFVFLIAGAICFIPGAYHVVYIYCAVKGRRGFDFHNLPLFN